MSQSFIHFDRHNRFFEDRSPHRYSAKRSEVQFIWMKARLWEQFRRFESRYAFTTENCARQLLRHLELACGPNTSIVQPGMTSSPIGIISQLQARGRLSRYSRVRHPLSSQLSRHREALDRTRHRLKSEGLFASDIGHLSPQRLLEWTTFLTQIPADSENALLISTTRKTIMISPYGSSCRVQRTRSQLLQWNCWH